MKSTATPQQLWKPSRVPVPVLVDPHGVHAGDQALDDGASRTGVQMEGGSYSMRGNFLFFAAVGKEAVAHDVLGLRKCRQGCGVLVGKYVRRKAWREEV